MLYFVSSSRFQKPFAMISRLYIYCTYVPAYRIANTIKRVPITTEVALYTITNIFIKRIWKVGGIYIYSHAATNASTRFTYKANWVWHRVPDDGNWSGHHLDIMFCSRTSFSSEIALSLCWSLKCGTILWHLFK